MRDPDQLSTLLLKKLEGRITAEEARMLDEWQLGSPVAGMVADELQQEESLTRQLKNHHPDNWKEANDRIKATVEASLFPSGHVRTFHRVHFLKTTWFRYAAVIILLFGAGVYIWSTQRHSDQTMAHSASVEHDIMPGTKRAILTLANGETIALDSKPEGQLATEDGSVITKKDGSLIYDNGLPASSTVSYNTMSTPRGGQYQIILGDGTKVWLNAESSITFPTAFAGSKREVTIKGEAYFDVAKDAAKPFIVNVNNRSGIEVLGTQFNVNSYIDEDNINTTLLEGAVKVWAGSGKNAVILQPGEESQIAALDGSLKVVTNTDLAKVAAWKNGVFNFEDLSLEKAMRQLARWYDIQVVYQQPVRALQFGGTLKKSLPLSSILHFLEGAGLRYKLEGKNRLVILNN